MNQTIINNLAKDLNIKVEQVKCVLDLLSDNNTVPFIARYRKEATGSLTEEQIFSIEKEYKYLANLEKRKEEIIRLIDERGMLTAELAVEINKSIKLQQVEDLYLPYKEKRKTKATEAIKKGLEPLANYITNNIESNYETEATKYLNEEVASIEEAISGAGFIISERISDTAKYREYIRNFYFKNAILNTKVKKNGPSLDEKSKYEMYYEFSQGINKIQSYRILAINRAEKEKIIGVSIEVNTENIIDYLVKETMGNKNNETYKLFIIDALKRLITPSIERETRAFLTDKASTTAIDMFAKNLDKLIMQPPVKNKIVLGLDPAFRTGCKIAVIDITGALLHVDVMFPTEPHNDIAGSSKKMNSLIKKYKVNQIVIGNGTASRETEEFVKNNLEDNTIPYNIISEAGASVYSASKLAQNEFPDLTVEKRSAVSIARRIQDPMAELVKIDPKSIGVGQYQHDVNQKELSENLDFTMIKNINIVGVDVNTASAELLKYVSGLDATIAKNIVAYREENGVINSRTEIKKVKRLGPKAFEQAAGFLKILDGKEPLDQTFIHPESYSVAKKIIKDLKIDIKNLGTEEVKQIVESSDKVAICEEYDLSIILLNDILKSLTAPNIDARGELTVASFDKAITKIEDLKIGMIIEGEVRNIIEFGAFVDIGLKNDALVHISEISNSFVKNVSDFLEIGDIKKFKVKEVDVEKGRIQLSLKES